jgi:hypothetical protein
MASRPQDFGLKKVLRNLTSYVEDQRGKLSNAAAAGDAPEMFSILDDTKRAVGRWTRSAQAVERTADPVELLRGRATRDRLEGMYEGLRRHLEDEELWGKAAQDQKQINGAWSTQIEAQRRFERALTTEIGRDPKNPWRSIRGVDPAKADSYVRNLTNPSNDLTHQAVRDYVSSTKQLAQAIGEAYELPPEKAAEVGKAVAAADQFGGTITKAEGALTKANQMKALVEAEEKGAHSPAGIAIGAMLGHPVLGALAGASRVVTRPGHTAMQLAQVERWLTKSDGAIARGVRGLLGREAEGGAARAALPRPTARTASAAAAGPRTSRIAAYAGRVAALHAAAASPEEHAAMIAHRLSDVSGAAPRVASAAASVAARATAFLAAQEPKHAPTDMLGGKASPPNSEEMDRFLRYAHAIDDPASVLDHMKHGTLTTDEVVAVRSVYPLMYEEMRRQVVNGLTDAIASGRDPGYQRRLQIAALFGAPTDVTMTPPFVRALQQSYAPAGHGGGGAPGPKPRAPSGAGAKPLSLARSTETRTQEISQ